MFLLLGPFGVYPVGKGCKTPLLVESFGVESYTAFIIESCVPIAGGRTLRFACEIHYINKCLSWKRPLGVI